MNVEALNELKRVVREAPDELFHMGTFGRTLFCGTVRCAAGWAATDAWFKERGFALEAALDAGDKNLRRATEFFDLHPYAGDVLFGGDLAYPGKSPSKEAVIANIDAILEGRMPVPYPEIGSDDEDDD